MEKYKWRIRHYKKMIKPILKRVLVVVIAALVLGLILSLFLEYKYNSILAFLALVIFCVGGLSVLGSGSTTRDATYNYHKSQTGLTRTTKEDLKLLQGSYVFCTYMGISAVIVYFISYIISLII